MTEPVKYAGLKNFVKKNMTRKLIRYYSLLKKQAKRKAFFIREKESLIKDYPYNNIVNELDELTRYFNIKLKINEL